MWAFLVRRLVGGLLTLWVILTFAFIITRVAPGSPFTTEKSTNLEARKIRERKFMLDRPIPEQYVHALWGYVRGDLGPQWLNEAYSVEEIVWPKFLVSIQLGLLSALLALAIGIPLGVVASAGRNGWPDHVAITIAVAGICLPNFVIGPLMRLVFSFNLNWMPPTGWPETFSMSELSKLVMPSITLALVHIAYLSRLTRAGMLDVLNQDYIRTARAKGVPDLLLFLKHALKNGVTPALSYSGPMIAYVITGSLVVEQVFNIPGLGSEFVRAALKREGGLLVGCTIVYGGMVIVFNAIVDLLYAVLDPRVRVQ